MTSQEQPHQGGRYIRHKDGRLERVGGTDNDPKPAPAELTEIAADPETPVAAATSTKKGK